MGIVNVLISESQSVPDPVCETEIAEMKQLYDYGPERACLDRMIWLEVEHTKMSDENEYLQSANESTHKAAVKVIETLREALNELAKTARTTEQLDMVHEFKCKGLIK